MLPGADVGLPVRILGKYSGQGKNFLNNDALKRRMQPRKKVDGGRRANERTQTLTR
jgi:hypothetical protein